MLGAERVVLFSFLCTLRPLVASLWLLRVIAAVDEHRVPVGRRFLQQQPLQHLFVGALPSEVVLVNLELWQCQKTISEISEMNRQ